MLVDRAERGDGRRAGAVGLAEAFGPELHIPVREAQQPVGIGHHHHGGDAALLGEADRERRAERGRELRRGPGVLDRLDRGAPTGAERVDIEAARKAGQEADIGEGREPSADIGRMVEDRDAERR